MKPPASPPATASTTVITSVIIDGVELKVTQIGNSLGVILPKELLAQLKVGKGDSLHALTGKDGITLSPFDPEFADQMAAAEAVMRQDRDVLRRLGE